MDSRRRRQLRHKYLEEEERLGKMSRGLAYEENDDLNEETNENKNSRYVSHTPKYKARTFKNILRDFDDPNFDESQYYGQNYQREEIDQDIPEDPDSFIVTPKHDAAIARTMHSKLDDEQISIPGNKIQDETEEIADKLEENNSPDDYEFDTDMTETTETEEDEDTVPLDLPSDYQPQPIRRKKTLRQMEAEERRRHTSDSRLREENTDFNTYKGLQKHRTPAPVRWLVFIAFIMLAFLVGYYICGGVLSLLNIQPGNNTQSEQQVNNNLLSEQGSSKDAEQQGTPEVVATSSQNSSNVKSHTIFVPKGGSLTSINVEQKPAPSNEQMLKGVLNAYLDSVKEVGLLSVNTELAELWIAGDTLYLSMNQNFVTDVKRLNATNATLLMRGFLRTINTNMSSVKKLKVFIDSQEITITQPIDLTRVWEAM